MSHIRDTGLIWVIAESEMQKLIFGAGAQKVHKNRYQIVLVLPNFSGFFYIFQIIFERIIFKKKH